MKVLKGCAVVWMMAASLLGADWKITTVTTREGASEEISTSYYKGKLHRNDSELIAGHPLVSVEDFEKRRMIQWQPREKQWAIVFEQSAGTPLAKTLRNPAEREIYVSESVTRDTGERRDSFGWSARHLITPDTRSMVGGLVPRQNPNGKL